MPAIREASLVSRAELSPYPSTTSRKTKVCVISTRIHDHWQFHGHITHQLLTCIILSGEKARITAAGGFVDFGRVNGNLALSRAIGDFEFKKSAELAPEQQIVTAYPDVMVHELGDDDEFLVIACDGELTAP